MVCENQEHRLCRHEGKKKCVLKPGISRTVQCHEDVVELVVSKELSQELKAEKTVSSAMSHKLVLSKIQCCHEVLCVTGSTHL